MDFVSVPTHLDAMATEMRAASAEAEGIGLSLFEGLFATLARAMEYQARLTEEVAQLHQLLTEGVEVIGE